MGLIDFILNLAGLLLWLNWRAGRVDPMTRATPTALLGTLKRAEPPKWKRWYFLAALAALVLLRAIIYGQIGPAVNWAPKLDLGVVMLGFPIRGRVFLLPLLYSALSLLYTLVVVYFWLLALACINHRAATSSSFDRMLRLQLGRPADWPRPVQLLLPLVTVGALWVLCQPLLIHAGVIHRAQSLAHLGVQGLLVSLGVYLSLKCFLPVILFLHLVADYVYLGDNPFWGFVGRTARRLVAPLQRMPLRVGKVDLAPLAGIALILLLLHFLPWLIQYFLERRGLTLWPN